MWDMDKRYTFNEDPNNYDRTLLYKHRNLLGKGFNQIWK